MCGVYKGVVKFEDKTNISKTQTEETIYLCSIKQKMFDPYETDSKKKN